MSESKFEEFDAVSLVTITDFTFIDNVEVAGCHVRVTVRVTKEERALVDFTTIKANLIERGAISVSNSLVTVRGRSVKKARTSVGGVEAVETWLDDSGEENDVIVRAKQLLVMVAK